MTPSAALRPPALFVSHGAPTFAFEADVPGPAGSALAGLARRIGTPSAVLVVSAHWDSAAVQVGGALRPTTIHDFHGFPAELYALRYPAPGAYCAAMAARDRLEDAGIAAELDLDRGLDHGAWVPLRLMYPGAEVPVVPLSIQSRRDPAHHYRVGRALAPLRDDGVLILASGGLTHNLRQFGAWYGRPGPAPAYVGEFAEWFWQRVEAGDIEALLDYRRQAPGAAEAHPTDEHLLPFFVALGAAGDDRPERVLDAIYHQVLAMDAYAFWPQGLRT